MKLYCTLHIAHCTIVVIFLLICGTAQATVLETYFQDFSNFADGVTINGKDYWNVFSGSADNAITQSSITPTGTGNSLKLAGALSIPKIERPFSYGGLTPTWVSFKVRPAISAQTPSVPSGGIGAICFDYTGKVLAANGASWADTGATYTFGRWYEVTMRLNFNNHTYDLYLADILAPDTQFTPIKTNLGFIDSTKNSLSDLKFYGSYATSSQSNVYISDVSISYIDRLGIITMPQQLMQGQVSGPITLQLQDSTSSPQTALSNITLELKSTSNKGRFSLSRDPWYDVEQVILSKFSQNATFYYKDTSVGKPVISVKEFPDLGFTDALQQLEILSKVSRFDVEVNSPQVAGQGFKIKLTVRDENGNISELYNGAAKLSVNYVSPLSGASFISPGNISGFVKGSLEMNATYPDCGLVTITVTDSEDSDQIGTSSQILFLPAGFTVSAEGLQTSSKPFTLTITAKNAQGLIAPNYNGAVDLYPVAVTPLDISKAILSPLKVTGSNFGNGSALVDTFYNLYGTIKLRAEDSVDATKLGVSEQIEFLPKRITLNIIPAPGGRDFFYINEPIEIVTRVEDEQGNPIPNYPGVVELLSGIGLVLPGPYTFISADAGKHTFVINSTQEGSYTVIARAQQDDLNVESSKISVKNATIQVIDTTSPIGTGEVILQILDDTGKVITSESNLTIDVQALEDISNSSVSLSSNSVTFKEGKATIPITDLEAETVTIVPSSAYNINIKKGTITFGRAGKTGINQLMWRELKGKK